MKRIFLIVTVMGANNLSHTAEDGEIKATVLATAKKFGSVNALNVQKVQKSFRIKTGFDISILACSRYNSNSSLHFCMIRTSNSNFPRVHARRRTGLSKFEINATLQRHIIIKSAGSINISSAIFVYDITEGDVLS